jgi:hypothetical protein
MKLNRFSVTIAEGKETSDGYVQMKHGTQYTILLQNESNRRCDAEVYLDDRYILLPIQSSHARNQAIACHS